MDKKKKTKPKKTLKESILLIVDGTDFFGSALSMGGFLISQVFWLWILVPFSKFFCNYMIYVGVTYEYSEFANVFWMVYFLYFIISLVLRVKFNKTEGFI